MSVIDALTRLHIMNREGKRDAAQYFSDKWTADKLKRQQKAAVQLGKRFLSEGNFTPQGISSFMQKNKVDESGMNLIFNLVGQVQKLQPEYGTVGNSIYQRTGQGAGEIVGEAPQKPATSIEGASVQALGPKPTIDQLVALKGKLEAEKKSNSNLPAGMKEFELSFYGEERPDIRGTEQYLKDRQSFELLSKASASDVNEEEISSLTDAVANGQLGTQRIPKRGRVWAKTTAGVLEQYPKFNFSMNDANDKYRNDANILRSSGLVAAALPRVNDLYRKAMDLTNKTNLPILDKRINDVRKAVGSEAVTDFESLRNAVLFEVNTALSGSSVPSDYRIKIELENLESGMTFGQQIKSINNLISALQARADAATMMAYPLDVVRGQRSLDQWRKDQEAEAEKMREDIIGGSNDMSSMSDDELLKMLGQ